ncbi:MAG TPA: TatD family hydrolase [Anaerolineae bacterium]|nr:TatD family hydrolase [Anaerolineae bacterium]
MTILFDSHCHLTAEEFEPDRAAVIQRAVDAGVTRMLTLGTDVASSRAAIALAERFEPVYAAVGIHPEAVREASLDDLDVIRELAAHPKVIAIGEIGLDYYWDKTTAELQQTFFERQLELAADLRLPAAVHDREAHEKIIETIAIYKKVRGVLHAFSGSMEMAQRAFKLGYVISLGGPITFSNNQRAPELIRALPLDKILIETDSPYLAPQPFRGKRNEPAHVKLVAEHIAHVKGLSIERVAAQTTQNAEALFQVTGQPERE